MSKLRFDFWLVIPSLFLSFLGLLVLRSVAPEVFVDQLLFFCISIATFLILSLIDFTILSSMFVPGYVLSIIFLFSPAVLGLITRGAARWIPIGTFSLQPSELVKPMLLIAFASIANSKVNRSNFWLTLMGFIPAVIIFFQPDLGTSLVIFAGWLPVFFSHVNLKALLLLVLVGGLFTYPVYRYALRDYQRERLITFINPYRDPLDKGYHVIQSTIAVGSGGIWGKGLGHGSQSQLRFLPEHHTDFIFAALSEELGFVGSFLVILLFFILIWRIYKISQNIPDATAATFCLSAASMLSFQIFVNIGMNMGVAPITGITLPFLSYGGSSFLSLGIILGIINSISQQTQRDIAIRIR